MSDYTYMAIAFGCLTVMVVALVTAYAYTQREPGHVHSWTAHAVKVTASYASRYRHEGELPQERYSDVSGMCATCGAPLMKTFDGVWQMPADSTADSEESK